MELILASNSPRRKELLEKAGYKFEIMPSDFEEKIFSLDPILTAVRFAEEKAKDVFIRLNKKDALVIGSDTVVYLDGQILGKPENQTQAESTLKLLSGKTHRVVSGYALVSQSGVISGYDITNVKFNHLSSDLIKKYIDSGLYKGKAGAYGIQDGFGLVGSYEGSLNNVIGLPTEKLFPLLNKYFL